MILLFILSLDRIVACGRAKCLVQIWYVKVVINHVWYLELVETPKKGLFFHFQNELLF
jgi:hypothetical protein